MLVKKIVIWLVMGILVSCTPAIKVPIEKLEYKDSSRGKNKNLLILLRGIGGSHRDFEKMGVVGEIRRRQLPFDIVAPNSHFGYYKNRSLVERLKQDIIDPAKAQGYQTIWLAGFSMGGLGALLYAREYPDDVDGMILVSPYLGSKDIIEEIKLAGGVRTWLPSSASEDDWERGLWSWIKDYDKKQQDYPIAYLGFGSRDPVVNGGPQLLAVLLEPEHVVQCEGGHKKKTMRKIFFSQLDHLMP
jgi:pimeloyl-ACP methyl ester carboxylesterase